MSQLDAFRSAVESFLSRSKMSATRFGKEAVNDPNFVHDLRSGRVPSMAMADRVLAFIASQAQPERAA